MATDKNSKEQLSRRDAQQKHDPAAGAHSQTGNPEGAASLQHTRRQVVTTEHKAGDPMVNPVDEHRDDIKADGSQKQEPAGDVAPQDPRQYLPVDSRGLETAYATRDNIVVPTPRDAHGNPVHLEAQRVEVARMNKVVEEMGGGGYVTPEVGLYSGDEKEAEKQRKAADKAVPDHPTAFAGTG